MGWTWGVGHAIDIFNKYPSLAEVPEFVARWPGLKEELGVIPKSELNPEVVEALKKTLPDVEVGAELKE